MSLVGTRPILQDELQKYELHHRARIAIKPGITGMWQVSGRSDITDFEEVVRLDGYIHRMKINPKEHQKLRMDVTGNQLFCYCFGYAVSKKTNSKFVLDTSMQDCGISF